MEKAHIQEAVVRGDFSERVNNKIDGISHTIFQSENLFSHRICLYWKNILDFCSKFGLPKASLSIQLTESHEIRETRLDSLKKRAEKMLQFHQIR